MRKKAKQYIQKSLCSILSAAMILTSLSMPSMTAYAAQADEVDETEVSEEEPTNEGKSEKVVSTQETDDGADSDVKSSKDETVTEDDEDDFAEKKTSEKSEAVETEKNSDKNKESEKDNDKEKINRTFDNREGEDGGNTTDNVITLYYYSEDLKEYEDTDTEKYNLYLSTWNNTKISSTNEEVQLSQGDWGGYAAYAFEEVTDESINLGYDNWYSVPVKVLAAYDGADGDGFVIQTAKATTAEGTTSYELLNKELITISYWANKDIYSAIASLENGKSIVIKDGQMYESIESVYTTPSDDLQALIGKADALDQADYEADENWKNFQDALKSAKEVLASGESTDEEIEAAYNDLKDAMDALVLSGTVITLYYYSEALNDYEDTDTVKHNLYLSTWNNTKISSTNKELELPQGDADYAAYAFEKVTDESINLGYDNWYSIPVKVLAANDGENGDGFVIQTAKATITEDTTHTHEK